MNKFSSTRSDSNNDEVANLWFMGQQRQKNKLLEVSDLDSDNNPSYNELQNVVIEMHGDVMNAYKK
jgi:hypothetical protein